jgi:putative hemolysin
MPAKKKTTKAPPRRIIRRSAPKAKPSFLRKLATRGASRVGGAATSFGVGALEAVSPKAALLTAAGLIFGGSVVEALAPEGHIAEQLAGDVATANLGAISNNFGKSSTTKLLQSRQAQIEDRARELAREEFHGLAPEIDEETEEVAQVIEAPPKPSRRRKGA